MKWLIEEVKEFMFDVMFMVLFFMIIILISGGI